MNSLASITSWYSANESIIQQMLIYALLAFSVQVALRSGAFSLAGVGFYGIGSYAAGLLVKEQRWPAVFAVVAAATLAGGLGIALALLFQRLRDLYLGIATVAFVLTVGVVAVNWTGLTGGPLGLSGIPTSVTTLAVLVTVVVAAALLTLLERGTIGRTFVAIREDEELARCLAVDVRRYRRFAFALSCVLGAVAGAYHALIFVAVDPADAGFTLITLALAMVIIGGFGSWVGALIGAVILTWVPYELSGIGQWWAVVYGALMILMGTFAGGGLLGIVGDIARSGGGRHAGRLAVWRRGRTEPALPASTTREST